MRFGFLRRSVDLITPGARMRREHSLWLSRAVARSDFIPRIPTRRVSEGGFSLLLSSPGGRERAEQWWMDAFGEIDHIR